MAVSKVVVVDGNNLIVRIERGVTGPQGPQGPEGPAGPAGTVTPEMLQILAETELAKDEAEAAAGTATTQAGIATTQATNSSNSAIASAGSAAEAANSATISTITDATTARTLSAGDNGKFLYFTSASAVLVTIPSGLGVSFSCVVIQAGTAQVTLAAGSGVTLNSYGALVKTAGQYATANLFAPVANTFIAAGQLA